jgi:hypothetical protein
MDLAKSRERRRFRQAAETTHKAASAEHILSPVIETTAPTLIS